MGSHTEGASGVLGVVKTVMMLEKGVILPNANFEEMSSNIIGRENLKVRYHRDVIALQCISDWSYFERANAQP